MSNLTDKEYDLLKEAIKSKEPLKKLISNKDRLKALEILSREKETILDIMGWVTNKEEYDLLKEVLNYGD